jgi:hypothetical protein
MNSNKENSNSITTETYSSTDANSKKYIIKGKI